MIDAERSETRVQWGQEEKARLERVSNRAGARSERGKNKAGTGLGQDWGRIRSWNKIRLGG